MVKRNKITFERVEGSTVFGINVRQQETETAQIMVPKGTSISSQKAHGMLGHVNMDATKATMLHWGWKIKGKTSQCEDCIIGKAKQKSVKKSTNTHATKPGERLFVDISSVNATSAGGRRY